MNVDIVYSLTCHESPESFSDTIENIKYFNTCHRIAIIVNTNCSMFGSVKEDDIVRVVPTPWNKQLNSYDLFKAHLENYNYTRENHIHAKYFIMLASNCMFHRQVTMHEIEEGVAAAPACDVKRPAPREKGWFWPHFYQNTQLLSVLSTYGFGTYIGAQHEGMVLPMSTMENIYKFAMTNRLEEQITCRTVFEEFLPASFYAFHNGKQPYHICKVFWEKRNYTPSIDDIRGCSLPCVKRVARQLDDPVRVWLKTLRT